MPKYIKKAIIKLIMYGAVLLIAVVAATMLK